MKWNNEMIKRCKQWQSTMKRMQKKIKSFSSSTHPTLEEDQVEFLCPQKTFWELHVLQYTNRGLFMSAESEILEFSAGAKLSKNT